MPSRQWQRTNIELSSTTIFSKEVDDGSNRT